MSPFIHVATGDRVAAAVRAIGTGRAVGLGPTRAGLTPFDDRALLHELWQISHFGWIPEATIRRGLMIASGHELAAAALAERLGQLQQLGWVDERHGKGAPDEREWRPTDRGRSAV